MRRIERFFDQAFAARVDLSQEPRLRWIDAHQDEWAQIAETNRGRVVCVPTVRDVSIYRTAGR